VDRTRYLLSTARSSPSLQVVWFGRKDSGSERMRMVLGYLGRQELHPPHVCSRGKMNAVEFSKALEEKMQR
jgi:hypothetical protein